MFLEALVAEGHWWWVPLTITFLSILGAMKQLWHTLCLTKWSFRANHFHHHRPSYMPSNCHHQKIELLGCTIFSYAPQKHNKDLSYHPKDMNITTSDQKYLNALYFACPRYMSSNVNIFKIVLLKSSELTRFCKCFLIQIYTYSLVFSKKSSWCL